MQRKYFILGRMSLNIYNNYYAILYESRRFYRSLNQVLNLWFPFKLARTFYYGKVSKGLLKLNT